MSTVLLHSSYVVQVHEVIMTALYSPFYYYVLGINIIYMPKLIYYVYDRLTTVIISKNIYKLLVIICIYKENTLHYVRYIVGKYINVRRVIDRIYNSESSIIFRSYYHLVVMKRSKIK